MEYRVEADNADGDFEVVAVGARHLMEMVLPEIVRTHKRVRAYSQRSEELVFDYEAGGLPDIA